MSHLENREKDREWGSPVNEGGLGKKDMTRRSFFKLAGMAVAGAASLGLPGISQGDDLELWSAAELAQKDFWDKVRGQFILDPNLVYLNIGTTGSMPRKILKNYNRYNELAAYHPKTFESELGATFGLPAQRKALAAQFGCNMDEICLSRNTTDGMDAIVYGLRFHAGDEILITHHEHIAALSPLNVLQDRDGVIIRQLEIPVLDTESPDQFVQLFRNNITNNTKAILFSHITYKTGTRLPAKALCALAREHGLISIVDGAHCPGMIQLDFHDIGCDFYASPGHKWQCGPGETGILYLRNQGDDLPEFWTQNSSLYTSVVQPTGNVRGQYDIGYSLQYRGQLNIPAHLAMMDACQMWEEIGRGRIEQYVCKLSSYLKKTLKNKFAGAGTFFCPDIPQFTSGLTSFNPFADIHDNNKVQTLVNRLDQEAGYQARSTNFRLHIDDPLDAYAVRISTHIFHNKEQINGLVNAMYDLYLQIEG